MNPRNDDSMQKSNIIAEPPVPREEMMTRHTPRQRVCLPSRYKLAHRGAVYRLSVASHQRLLDSTANSISELFAALSHRLFLTQIHSNHPTAAVLSALSSLSSIPVPPWPPALRLPRHKQSGRWPRCCRCKRAQRRPHVPLWRLLLCLLSVFEIVNL